MWRVKALFDAGRVCMSLLGQVLRGLGGSPHQKAWTLILWNQGIWLDSTFLRLLPLLHAYVYHPSVLCAADVPLPDQLKGPDGLHKVYDLLVDKFATSRGYDLHCVKLACGWLGETTRAIKQLAPLMKLGHLEALTVVHRGRERGASTTDRLLRQVCSFCSSQQITYPGVTCPAVLSSIWICSNCFTQHTVGLYKLKSFCCTGCTALHAAVRQAERP